ncbi:MAG: NAD(P)-binding domain-containing protein, partial [Firmicutes bacterium]|nr:NAD(P)-binding domain-containing protein [Bacillota bacterium]
MKIGIIGAGSWGTALAIHLAGLKHDICMWDLDTEHLRRMAEDRENKDYLPGIVLPNNIHMEFDEAKALKDAEIALFSVPAQHFGSAFTNALAMLPENATIVNVAKGIDQNSLKTMSQIALEIKPDAKYVVLSGPSHAE